MQDRAFFPLAPMSRAIGLLTYALLALPVALFVWGPKLVAGILAAGYLLVWLWFRPRGFELTDKALIIRWPLRRQEIRREQIRSARRLGSKDFCTEYGWAVRVGVGGLWGGFGYLWTKRGLLKMYISRADALVLVELTDSRNLLISPRDADRFAAALA